jgi:hypothetical protein
MAAKCTYLMNRVLDRVLLNNAQYSYAWPATVYAALFITGSDPGAAGDITGEPAAANAYARQAISWDVIAAGSVTNVAAITFPVAGPAGWGEVRYVGIMDVITLLTGNMLYHGTLGTPKTVSIGDQVSFAIAALTVTES